jgi:inosine/xanthosine triphosphate pyrophosphatase family protein
MLQFQLMKELIFSTGNDEKFLTAKHTCDNYGIKLTQKSADIVEIQEESPEKVAVDKAAKAFALLKRPVVITDDSWSFSGLKGFPGVYMHSINEWFTPDDFLRLVLPLADRKAILTQYLVYDDGQEQKVFSKQTEGELLKEIRGTSKHPSHTVITLTGDNGLSIAEAYDQATDKSTRKSAQIWQDFADWFSKR